MQFASTRVVGQPPAGYFGQGAAVQERTNASLVRTLEKVLLATLAVTAVLTTLLAVAVRRSQAAAPALGYDAAYGRSYVRREAVVRLASDGAYRSCSRVTTSAAAEVICPFGFGAVDGGCGGGARGDLLVASSGSGWVCPEPKTRDSVAATALCCK